MQQLNASTVVRKGWLSFELQEQKKNIDNHSQRTNVFWLVFLRMFSLLLCLFEAIMHLKLFSFCFFCSSLEIISNIIDVKHHWRYVLYAPFFCNACIRFFVFFCFLFNFYKVSLNLDLKVDDGWMLLPDCDVSVHFTLCSIIFQYFVFFVAKELFMYFSDQIFVFSTSVQQGMLLEMKNSELKCGKTFSWVRSLITVRT